MSGWKRVLVVVGLAAFASALAFPAQAHKDHRKDAKGKNCDTWYRKGHTAKGSPGSHEHTGSADVKLPNGTTIHNHGGHYVIRGDQGYLEIVGGQGYSSGGNQGGYVQGEFDPGMGFPGDVDGHVDLFAGENSPFAKGSACISVADNKVSSPVSGPTGGTPSPPSY